MSTRAVYVFEDESGPSCVYKHHDGYPKGASGFLIKAIEKAWPLPRFEADDFAAAFIVANWNGPGSVRLTPGPDRHGDLAYVYFINFLRGELVVAAHSRSSGDRFYCGSFEGLATAKPGEWHG